MLVVYCCPGTRVTSERRNVANIGAGQPVVQAGEDVAVVDLTGPAPPVAREG